MNESIRLPRLPGKRLDGMEAYRTIRRSIVDGVLRPGERLVEERLANDLGVSRTPIREALAMLEVEGLIRSLPNKGAMVRAFSREEIKDLYDLRILLEGYAARQAGQTITTDDLDQLRRLYEEMSNCIKGNWRPAANQIEKVRYLAAKNNQFHNVIVRASRNSRLEMILTQTIEVPLIFRAFFWYTKDQLIQSNQHHFELIGALENHDGEEAQRIMALHIGAACGLLLKEVDAQHEWATACQSLES